VEVVRVLSPLQRQDFRGPYTTDYTFLETPYTMAYVPPSKRPGFVAKTTDKPPWVRPARKTQEDHLLELETLFLTPQQGTFNYFAHKGKAPARSEGPANIEGTLPSNLVIMGKEKHPLRHIIVYIMIFPRAQPLWELGAELWSHTGAEGMINDWKGNKANFDRPIPVFEGASSRRDRFTFVGWWYVVQSNQLLWPNSTDVQDDERPEGGRNRISRIGRSTRNKRTCQRYISHSHPSEKTDIQGYSRAGRTKEAWETALSEQWIKTRFTPVEESFERYSELVDPTTLGPGEGAKLVLSVGGLVEESKTLESLQTAENSTAEGGGAESEARGESVVEGQDAA
jgi:hypothetical protein